MNIFVLLTLILAGYILLSYLYVVLQTYLPSLRTFNRSVRAGLFGIVIILNTACTLAVYWIILSRLGLYWFLVIFGLQALTGFFSACAGMLARSIAE